jgi:hypothetical protein
VNGHATIEKPELGYNSNLSIEQIPPTSSIVSVGSRFVIESNLKSIMIPQEIMGKYLVTVQKLKKKLIGTSLDDHLWSLKSWDQNGIGVVKLWCGECCKEFEGLVVTIINLLSIILLENLKITI